MHKLVVFVDESGLERVKNALFSAGAGKIGDYDRCCFVSKGTGQFRPLEGSTPYIGSKNQVESVAEWRIEVVVEKDISSVVAAMKSAHPYETPAYDVIKLENF